MQKFMLAYHGGNQPSSKEEGMAHMQKWKLWIESLGDQVINPGTPLPVSKIITNEGVQEDTMDNAMNGFAVIQAENLNAALEIAKTDPFLNMGGQIRVSQMMEMK